MRGVSERLLLGALVAVALTFPLRPADAGETGYYRWPALHGDVLVFASEGDLWRAPAGGGEAARLTSHPDLESWPAISPDGRWLAFSASYDATREVYVMPVSGGAPRQLTFEGGGTTVRGWSPSGKVLFTSQNASAPRERLLRLADPGTGAVETLPLASANEGVFSGHGRTVFFTRYGLSTRNDNAVLYRGGAMSQLWKADLGSNGEAMRLAADFDAPIRDPMWWDGRVYFVSDKSGSDNIWSVDEAGADARQHTRFQGWQLRHPRLDGGIVVYQRGADLFRYDLRSDAEVKIDLTLVSDRDHGRVRWIDHPTDYLEAVSVGPTGQAVALTARGRIAVAAPGERRRVELDVPEGARARGAVLGGKGNWVYVILDQGLQGEIWRYPADGRGAPRQLTTGLDGYVWSLHPSPDGHAILFDDKQARLWSLDPETGKTVLVDSLAGHEDQAYADFAWSLDGRYVAYSRADARDVWQVVLRDMQSGQSAVVSGTKYQSYAPAFSPDGGWLYFISDRNFEASPGSPWGDRNMGPAFGRRGMLFAIQLQPGTRFPFAKPDELSTGARADSEDPEDQGGDTGDGSPEVAFDGIAGRLWQVPVDPGNYEGLAAGDEYLFVLERVDGVLSLDSIKIDPEDPAVETFWSDLDGFALSADRETVLVRSEADGDLTLALLPVGAKAEDDVSPYRVRTAGWRIGINLRDEWRQMLMDAWRLHRDFAFDRGLRGVDWNAVLAKYRPLVDRLGDRSELDDLLSQMAAELGILHSQVRYGDQPNDPETGVPAFLGADTVAAPKGLEVSRIYQGERDLPDRLGPLLAPGVDVRVGDVLTAVDGRPVRQSSDLWAALLDKAGRQVRLDLLRGQAATSAIVHPVRKRGLDDLRYRDWVERNRRTVAAASGDRIGYLALRAMGRRDIASFARDFYEHFDKDGLIVDVRGNSGGNIDSWLLTTLLRRVWAFWVPRVGGPPSGNMQQTFRGHLAVLIDPGTYSDGETFAAGVKALCLGTLVGERTAGAGIWLSNRNYLSDGGIARVAQTAQYRLDGAWMVEGHGVAPDVPVVNLPRATFAGGDAQLDAAIRALRAEIHDNPIPALKDQPLPPLGGSAADARREPVPSWQSCR